ncbi:MAG TPA: hypothetical protein VJ720_07905 [Chitinophaga sp.]|nr:hypothetical protein [Chitinophaga sp.]
MNYLTLLTLFPRKVNVTLIDAISNQVISKRKILKQELPELFNKPTVLSLENEQWQVLKADPISADDFHFTKKLTLHVQRAADFSRINTRSLLPTISGQPPLHASVSSPVLITIPDQQWAQLQFLPSLSLPLVEEELSHINNVISANSLIGYDQVHVRPSMPPLQIAYPDFLSVVSSVVTGNIDNVSNGFALRSENHTYYGILEDGIITQLCLYEFQYIDDELSAILNNFNLLLADWCNGDAISLQ